MVSYRRLAFLLVFGALASTVVHAQSSSSQSAQPPAAAPQPAGQLTVQARIRARREQRRVAAIHDVYSHLYEAYLGAGYLRFHAGPNLQRLNEYAWNVGVTRYYSEHLGVTIDGRGTYGTTFLGLNPVLNSSITRPAISEYAAMIGPTYRFVLHPKYSVSGRVLAGGAFGNFSGDLGPFTTAEAGLYPNGASLAINAAVPVEYNMTPGVGLRLSPEYTLTNFGSTTQNSFGFTAGLVVRWGKQ